MILFPASLTYYEKEVTRLVDIERYEDALHLCEWLKQTADLPPLHIEKLDALHNWLKMLLPAEDDKSALHLDEIETDEELLWSATVQTKSKKNPRYVKQLLDDLHTNAVEKQWNALAQLAYVEENDVQLAIRTWLTQKAHHPMIQFKALQTLKNLQCLDVLVIPRGEEMLVIDLKDVPLHADQFPPSIQHVLKKIEQHGSSAHPDFFSFVSQTWMEFLSFHYGSKLYQDLIVMNHSQIANWASALYMLLREQLQEQFEVDSIYRQFGVSMDDMEEWNRIYVTVVKFIQRPLK